MPNTRMGQSVKEDEKANLLQSVLTDILTDERFLELVTSHVDTRLAKLQSAIDKQAAKIIELEDTHEKRVRGLEECISQQEARILQLEHSGNNKEKGIRKLQDSLSKKDEEIAKMKWELNSQEQYSRRNCLRFFGIPEKDKEDTDNEIISLVSSALGVNLGKADIERSHRLRPQLPSDSKRDSCPIIVKFVSYRKRSEVLGQRRKLAGSRRSIQEDLTRDNAKLLKATRDHPKVKAAWTRDGRIIALVPATNGREMKKGISSEADLSLL